MSVSKYAEQVVDNFITNITDHVFLSIEQDKSLMREYMTNVDRYGLDVVNMAIGKKVGELLNLEDIDERKTSKSQLIKSYTCHKRNKP